MCWGGLAPDNVTPASTLVVHVRVRTLCLIEQSYYWNHRIRPVGERLSVAAAMIGPVIITIRTRRELRGCWRWNGQPIATGTYYVG